MKNKKTADIKEYRRQYYLYHSAALHTPQSERNKTKSKEYRHQYYMEHLANNHTRRIPETKEERQRKQLARYKLNVFIKRHYWNMGICQICKESPASEIHHPDYNELYCVNFLCHECHHLVTYHNETSPDPIDLTYLMIESKGRKINNYFK
jgi:hypothetical protein